MTTITCTMQEVPISEHPDFHTKRTDWGVIPAHWGIIYDEYENETGREWIPENRSKYRPELDGMSMADMWDYERGDWRIQPPGFEGITAFVKPVVTIETNSTSKSAQCFGESEK